MKSKLVYGILCTLLWASCKNETKPTVQAADARQVEAVAGTTYTADSTSLVDWEGAEGFLKIIKTHTGVFPVSNGTLVAQAGVLSGGKFDIDISGMRVTDLKGKGKAELEEHLKAADFFDTEKFPKAFFEITSVAPAADSALVVGNLTLKGVSKSISFKAKVQVTDALITASTAKFFINRKDWGMNYQSENSLGDELIRPEVGIKLFISAKK
jgi:polyisoprenoid-binding protein YceI